MTLFRGHNLLKRAARGFSETKRPVPSECRTAPFAAEIMRHAGWVIFKSEDHFARGHDAFFAVHEDTGQERHVDIKGHRRVVDHTDQMLRKMADLGFPPRTSLSPLTEEEIDAMHAARFGQAAE